MVEKKSSRLGVILAEDIMTEDVSVIEESQSMGQVAHLMLRHRVSGYPVVNKSGGLVGIITLSDLFIFLDKLAKKHNLSGSSDHRKFFESISTSKDYPIKDIMSHTVLTISSKTSVEEIIEKVVENKVHTFPVVEDGKIVGIIGRHDVLNATFVYG